MKNLFQSYTRSLTVKFLYLLLIYLAVFVAVSFVSFNAEFGFGWDALLKSPAGSRIDTAAQTIADQIRLTPKQNWTNVLTNFGKIYQVKFYLFDAGGEQLAGEAVTLPAKVQDKVSFHPPFGSPHLAFGGPDPPFLLDRRPGPPPDFQPDFGPISRPRLHPRPLPQSDLPPGWPPPAPPPHGRFLIHTNNPDCFWFGTHLILPSIPGEPPRPLALVAMSDNIWQSNLLIDLKMVALTLGIVLIFSMLFWLPFILQITKALTALTRATEEIADGHFDTRLNTKRNDELGRLAEAVNSMAERISIFVIGQKRLMGDISHELCTPIARLQMALELLHESSTADQQNMINDIKEEVTEMNSLVNELLAFSKAELKGTTQNLVPVPLKPLVQNLALRLGMTESISIQIGDEVVPLADHMLLERAIGNMLRNSMRYAGSENKITISGLLNGEDAIITITDQGPGVPPESLKHLGEPFFRPEASRSRSYGGAGLGLAIVKSCITACQGTMVIRNKVPQGLEIEIKLKAAKV